MADEITLTKELLGKEDMVIGTGTVSQVRNGVSVTINKVNIKNLSEDILDTDASVVARDTRFFLYDVDNGQLERVTVGAADSGGAGFKVLRIPN